MTPSNIGCHSDLVKGARPSGVQDILLRIWQCCIPSCQGVQGQLESKIFYWEFGNVASHLVRVARPAEVQDILIGNLAMLHPRV
jgi:hypothetical protein